MSRVKEENQRLRNDKSALANGIEKGTREVMESKDKEIDKLQVVALTLSKFTISDLIKSRTQERVACLENEVCQLKQEKDALERELENVQKAFEDESASKVDRTDGERNPKVKELMKLIESHKLELEAKQREFEDEKRELLKVISEQNDRLKAEKKEVAESSGPEVERMSKELQKAQKDLQEAAVERERFQAQLEMLVQELEQKQVRLKITNHSLYFNAILHEKIFCLTRRNILLTQPIISIFRFINIFIEGKILALDIRVPVCFRLLKIHLLEKSSARLPLFLIILRDLEPKNEKKFSQF